MLIIMSSLGALFLASGLSGQFGQFNTSPPIDFTEIGELMLTYYAPGSYNFGTDASRISYCSISTRTRGEHYRTGRRRGGGGGRATTT